MGVTLLYSMPGNPQVSRYSYFFCAGQGFFDNSNHYSLNIRSCFGKRICHVESTTSHLFPRLLAHDVTISAEAWKNIIEIPAYVTGLRIKLIITRVAFSPDNIKK